MNSNISYNLSGKHGINKQVLLSNEDYLRLKGKSICCLATGYVMIWDGTLQYLHRWIFKLPKGDKQVVDHIDGDKLNCSRENLRLCSVSDNMVNRKKIGKGDVTTSLYKGVQSTKGGKWKANIRKDKIFYHLGTFETEKEAAEAYNTKAKELHQNFALLNIVI